MGVSVSLTATVVVLTALASTPAGATEVRPVPGSGSWTVDGHGNGHGHGLSQYGARGAAAAGLTVAQILAFYYPGTALATAPTTKIRVGISGAGNSPAVQAEPGLSITGVSGTLPTSGIDQWRLTPFQTGYTLQKHVSTGWVDYKALGTSPSLTFNATDGAISLYRTSGLRAYRGSVSAVRVGAGSAVINTLPLDDYVRGVVPSEMPASWAAAAVQSQAVAARTYGRYAIEHPRDVNFDICDTTACQVYGGLTAEVAQSNTAVAATAGRILTYQGSTIFAEFSASNGGMTSSGNQPYFVTKPDPYDNAATGDPYLSWTKSVAATDVAGSLGWKSVSAISITAREGGGEWGGLVSSAVVTGVNTDNSPASQTVTGSELAGDMGLPYRFFFIRPTAPLGAVDSMSMTALHTATVAGWAFDPVDTSKSSTVQVYVDSTRTVATANTPRPDVQSVYKTASANHGFSVAATVPGGRHDVCAYAVSLDGSIRTFLRCMSVTVPVDPLGHVDSITKVGTGSYRFAGWTFDPDRNGGPANVSVFVDGKLTGWFAVNSPRVDVQNHFGIANSSVGFTVPVTIPPGSHKVCLFAPNLVGQGAALVLQCGTLAA